ncbi:hypothetical protein ACFYOV_13645 [Streptomyces sp. NPDC005931]|uniref:hypothetical protein n=1 Tax=Streptomyces sp. NPDC005931 TaxID=3364737 RepID=UPI0036B45061
MIANLLTVADLPAATIRAALAESLAVPEETIDVADTEAEQDHRDWEAPVLCTYTRLPPGDLCLSLDIWTDDDRTPPLTEPRLARALATTCATPVLHPSDLDLPSAYWLAAPDGRTIRCRVEETDLDDEGTTSYRVDALEAPVADLPAARVGPLPEALDHYPLPTPVTQRFLAAHPNADSASAEGRTHYALHVWERLIRRLESNDWSPSGRYPEDLYARDLKARDDLAGLMEELDPPSAANLRADLISLDESFKAHTRGNDPTAPSAPDDHWWHHRTPNRPPW